MSNADSPLGVAPRDGGVDVAVYSHCAEWIDFCVFDDHGETGRTRLTRDGDIHRAFVPGVAIGARYGLRAHGPFEPNAGYRFDAAKLLVDPYAVAIDRPFHLDPALFAFGADTAAVAPKGIVAAPTSLAPGRSRVPWSRTILYELNLRGFTRLRMDMPEAARGTFAGLAHPAVVAHLVGLGVSSVEIMPADAFVDERHLPALGLSNAWGYNPVVLGAPDPRLAPGGWAEVRAATDALHDAGLEVILDIVLNHSGESDELGPTLSMRGLDNTTYYRLIPGDLARYINDMGTGNCIALDRPPVAHVALNALRRWMIRGGVDGFRFDLAPALGRTDDGFHADAAFFAAIASDPVLREAKMIAEPWDIGPGGYQLGNFPPGWGEWSDRFRDAARRFWRGDGWMRGEIATRIAGSRDIFPSAPAPSKGVNFITAHDGFTLRDLVSYDHKHNDANGEGNRDGGADNHSWNNGAEGDTDNLATIAARGRDMRNLLALLFVARGAPMLAMGAELGFTQHGNNNAYAQDNAGSWIDWDKADKGLIAFTRAAIAARRDHAALAWDAFPSGATIGESGLLDVEWRDADGPMRSSQQWEDESGAVLVVIIAAPGDNGVERVAVVLNRGHAAAAIRLPDTRDAMGWTLVLDSSDSAPAVDDVSIAAPARSTLIIAEKADPRRRFGLRPADPAHVALLADAAGIAPDWWDISGDRHEVTIEAKRALLAAMRLPAGTRDDARDSLHRLAMERDRRLAPFSLVGRPDEPLVVPLRCDPAVRRPHLRVQREDGSIVALAAPNEARRVATLDGDEIAEARVELHDLPLGRHRLYADDVVCDITIAPATAWLPPDAARRRWGLSAQLYAQRRRGDQGIGDFTTLGLIGEGAGRAGAAALGVNPLHMLFASNRERASPYHPSDRRFLDPHYIDVLGLNDLPTDAGWDAALATFAPQLAAGAASPSVAYTDVWRLKLTLLDARFEAFEKARLTGSAAVVIAEHDAFVTAGGESLWRFAFFEAIAEERKGQDWRAWPEALRAPTAPGVAVEGARLARRIAFFSFAQWLADRQLAAAAARAKAGGLEIGLYRDLAVGAAPDGAESWSRSEELADGVSVGAPPDPFSAEGQNWHLPPPDPMAGARMAWQGFSDLYGANMRHAGLLRIDHAMGLTRLFWIPQGGKPADGAYVRYPVADLIGHIALQSARAQCVVVGEDLGTVPEGFRPRLAAAEILCTRVVWFERRGIDFIPPSEYPPLAVSVVSTHDLPTLEGWWRGADIDERATLGFIDAPAREVLWQERVREKWALSEALQGGGFIQRPPEFEGSPPDWFVAAIHAFVAATPSLLAMAQVDDLAGETVATNLPGTDRERPNWRHRLRLEAADLFANPRAKAIIAALAARGKG